MNDNGSMCICCELCKNLKIKDMIIDVKVKLELKNFINPEDSEERKWLIDIMKPEYLYLFNNEIGDTVGKVLEANVEFLNTENKINRQDSDVKFIADAHCCTQDCKSVETLPNEEKNPDIEPLRRISVLRI